jgi:tRNA nucleotidyltransferase (CCA-adding enzyme)
MQNLTAGHVVGNMNEKLLNSSLANRTYLVGGCVRDELMGLPVNDRDYVVEATVEEFRAEFPDAPLVGNDFPVFIVDGDEVALTRTERSTGDSYGAFELDAVGVSIEDDLSRRDFTMNAIARNIVTGELVDPFDGAGDILDGHIKACFPNTFKEDPVRILRAARFAARFVKPFRFGTYDLLKESAHMLEHATKERIALEVEKMYKQSQHPSVFFNVLLDIGALKYIFPELDALDKVPAGPSPYHGDNTAFDHTMEAIDRAKKAGNPFHVFMAVLVHDLGKAVTPVDILPHHYGHEERSAELAETFFLKNRFSKKVKRFAVKNARLHMLPHLLTKATPKKLVKHFKKLRRNELDDFFDAWNADHPLTDLEVDVLHAVEDVIFFNNFRDVDPARVHEKMVTDLKRAFKTGPLANRTKKN